MTVILRREALEAIKESGRAAYPEEACGFLIGSWDPRRVDEARPMRNVATSDRATRFDIDPAETFRLGTSLRGTGREIVGVFHSHVDHPARPSAFDERRAWERYTHVIVAVERAKPVDLRAWVREDPGAAFREVDVQVE